MLGYFQDLAQSGRSLEELVNAIGDMPVPVPGRDQPMRYGDLLDKALLQFFADCLHQLDPEVYTFILDGRAVEGYDIDALLQQVTCPALLLQGKIGGLLEDDDANHAAALLSNSKLVSIPEAGHNLHLSQPEATLRAVIQFLESI